MKVTLSMKGGNDVQEQKIIQLIRDRNEQGMEELLCHYGALMRYIISPILRNIEDREDCLNEASMRIWDKIELYNPQRGTWTAWLTALTRNTALNYVRKINSEHRAEDFSEEIASTLPSPERTVLLREQKEALTNALEELSQKERSLFYRKYYYLQSTAQIASELAMTERSVEGKLYRLKRRLRKLMGGERLE